MAEQARVTSIDALEDFRASLIRYQGRATQALDDVSGEMKRTRDWLTFERRTHWQSQAKRAYRRLEQAEAELMTSRMSALKDDHSAQQLAVRKAQRNLEEVEERLKATKRWIRDFDSIVAPATKRLDSLRDRLGSDFPKAVGSMDQTIRALQDYADVKTAPKERRGPESDDKGGEE